MFRRSFRPVPIQDGSCVLHLPFYAYGANAQKAWDISGQGNHANITSTGPGSKPRTTEVTRVVNGTFTDNATGWTLGTGWTYASNRANKTAGTASDLEQSVPITVGKEYYMQYRVSRSAGTVTPQFGGVNLTTKSASENYINDIIMPINTGNLKFQADASFAGWIDNVFIVEIADYTTIGFLTNGVANELAVPDFMEVGNLGKELSVFCWVYVDSLISIVATHYNNVSSSWEMLTAPGALDPATPTYRCNFVVSGDGTLSAGGAKVYSLTGRLFSWALMGFTFNNGTLSLYLNAVLDTNPTKTYDASFTTIFDCSAKIAFGNDYDGSNNVSSRSKTLIGESLIFNRALSAQEVKNYFEMTRGRYGV